MNQAPKSGPLPLNGVRVVLLRGADRSGPLVDELSSRGAAVLLLPLIDFEMADDAVPLDAAVRELRDGAFLWLVITSVTTVRALKQRLADQHLDLAAVVAPGTRIAAVGEATASALAAEGLRAELVPARAGEVSSAAGLAAALAGLTPRGRVLLPQADLAAETLRHALIDQGWEVLSVIAYRTVAHPADPARRITAELAGHREDRPDMRRHEIDRDRFSVEVAAGHVDAVVFTSPSTVRRVAEIFPELVGKDHPGGFSAVMIGASTAREAVKFGLLSGTVAAEPTPVGIADAIAAAMQDHPDHEKLKAREEEHP